MGTPFLYPVYALSLRSLWQDPTSFLLHLLSAPKPALYPAQVSPLVAQCQKYEMCPTEEAPSSDSPRHRQHVQPEALLGRLDPSLQGSSSTSCWDQAPGHIPAITGEPQAGQPLIEHCSHPLACTECAPGSQIPGSWTSSFFALLC